VGEVARAVRRATPRPGTRPHAGDVEVPVTYDGEDLAEVGELTGLGERGVVEAHTAQEWTVAFCGFSPGFGYLVGTDDRLHVPRRSTPRTRVPAGAVALAGEFAGVYPRESPGGWQLIGHTGLRAWDIDRDPPALLLPGVRVRFVEVR
jgi:KipI family sensor histidine kinase inhibitor